MKPNFRTCPQCSTRNRLDKEFCVKCGEPLEGIQVGDATLVAKKAKPGFFISGGADERQSPVVPLVFVILTLGVLFAGWRYANEAGPAATPVQAGRPLTQPSLPASTPAPLDPGSADYQAGFAALRAGDLPNAVRLLRQAVSAANRPDYRLALAEALEKSGAPGAEFLAEYEGAAGLAPTNARYTAEWAKALNRAGRNADSIRMYEAALKIDPDNLANIREVANLYMRSNDLTRARPYLQKVVELQPDDLAPKQDLARALESAREYDGAVSQYQEILTAMPEADMSRALLAEVYMKQSRPDEALRILNEGIALNATAALLHREKGRVLDRQGRPAEAVTSYREYVRLSPAASDLRIFTDRIEQLSATDRGAIEV